MNEVISQEIELEKAILKYLSSKIWLDVNHNGIKASAKSALVNNNPNYLVWLAYDLIMTDSKRRDENSRWGWQKLLDKSA